MGTRCKASALPRWLGSLRLPHFPQPRRRNRLQTINQGVGPFYSIGVGPFYVVKAIRRFTLGQEGNNSRPIWTPGSDRITFTSDRDGTPSIYWQLADGSGIAERLTTAEEGTEHRPDSWSPDGRTLSFTKGPNPESLWTLSFDGENQPELLYDVEGTRQQGAVFSPDGRWLAYNSSEEGTFAVYVQPFPPTGVRYRVTEEVGNAPLWSTDGGEIFYRRGAQAVVGFAEGLLGISIATEPQFAFGGEQTIPIEGFRVFAAFRDYDITPNGEQFVMVFPADEADSGPARRQINIVLNWFEELKERVPVP